MCCLQASALPLSIIIVGIGGADFEGVYVLLYFGQFVPHQLVCIFIIK